MVYVILGMHKSGTTLISQLLHKSGINMGDFDETVNYDFGNKYERQETLHLNLEMLGFKNYSSLQETTPLKEDDSLEAFSSKMEEIITRLNNTFKDWGFKDPRTCLAYSYWRKYLPEHRIIFVYRSPIEVWNHYQNGIPPSHWIRKLRRGNKVLKSWYIYNSEAVRHLESTNMSIIITKYSQLVTSETVFKSLEAFLGLKLTDCRQPHLYRSRDRHNLIFNLMTYIQSTLFSRNITKLYHKIEGLSNTFDRRA